VEDWWRIPGGVAGTCAALWQASYQSEGAIPLMIAGESGSRALAKSGSGGASTGGGLVEDRWRIGGGLVDVCAVLGWRNGGGSVAAAVVQWPRTAPLPEFPGSGTRACRRGRPWRHA
jgi:hypothetical protein